jgi:hypothetical protein
VASLVAVRKTDALPKGEVIGMIIMVVARVDEGGMSGPVAVGGRVAVADPNA